MSACGDAQSRREWAATGKVTQPVPASFPGADKVSVWTPPGNERPG